MPLDLFSSRGVYPLLGAVNYLNIHRAFIWKHAKLFIFYISLVKFCMRKCLKILVSNDTSLIFTLKSFFPPWKSLSLWLSLSDTDYGLGAIRHLLSLFLYFTTTIYQALFASYWRQGRKFEILVLKSQFGASLDFFSLLSACRSLNSRGTEKHGLLSSICAKNFFWIKEWISLSRWEK